MSENCDAVQAPQSLAEASTREGDDTARMDRVHRLLDNLDLTQDSIVGASSFILSICERTQSAAADVVQVIMTERLMQATAPA